MKGTTHALVGGLAGAVAGHPGWAFVAGAVSHALLDFVPHRDDQAPIHLIADGCGTLAVLALALLSGNMSIAAGVIGGVIPDIENVPEILFKRRGWVRIFPSHWRRHEEPADRRWAAAEPAVLIAAALGLVAVALRTALHSVL